MVNTEQGTLVASDMSPIGARAQAQIKANESGKPHYIQHTGSTYGIYSEQPSGQSVATVMPIAKPAGLVSEHPDVLAATEAAAAKEKATGTPHSIRPTSTHTWGVFNEDPAVNDSTDTRLHELILGHLRTAGVSDADQQAADFVKRVRTGRAKLTPDNDAQLWGATSFALGATLPVDRREIVARQLIAILRRVREPHLRTWAPGDKLPSPPPAKMADLDGAVWMHQQAGNGCYRMSAKDRRKYANSSHDFEGVQVWPFLLDAEGPFTEVASAR